MPTWIPWCFTCLSLLGAYVNSKGNLLVSSIMWLTANIFWLYMDASRELWAQAGLYTAFISMNILGIFTATRIGESK